MGKKKDKEKFKANPFDYMGGGRVRELGDHLGVDASDYNINYGRTSGSGRTYKGDRDDYNEAVARAADSNYSFRRNAEAQALAGNKDFKEYAKNGFENVGDVVDANTLMRKLHKKAGMGGSFSSASDYAGVTHRSVQSDRDKLMEDLMAKTQAATPEAAPEPPPEAQFSITEEEDFANDEARDARIDEYERNRAFSGLIGDENTQDYMDNYKFNVASGLRNAGVETRGSNAPDFIL